MTNKYSKLKVFRFAKTLAAFRTKESRVLLAGNFGAMNLGDEAILSGQINELQKNKNTEICVASRYPEQIKKLHGKRIDAIPIKNPAIVFHEIMKSDIIIVGGGGLFCKSFEPIGGVLYQIYFALFFLAIPLIMHKKVFALGIGIYKNMYPANLKFVLFLLKKVHKVTVRDFHSFRLLQRKGVEAEIYKDNSYLMPLLTGREVVRKVLGTKYKPQKINVGVAVRLPFEIPRRQTFIKALADYISENPDYHFWFYNLDGHSNKINDEQVNTEIIKNIKNKKDNITIIQNSKHPALIFTSFKYMDYIIAMRLHSMIFADRLGIPFDGVAYDTKCETFLDSVGKKTLLMNSDLKNKFKRNIKK